MSRAEKTGPAWKDEGSGLLPSQVPESRLFGKLRAGSGAPGSGDTTVSAIAGSAASSRSGRSSQKNSRRSTIFAGADVEEIHSQIAGFEVITEDVGVVALLGGGDALFFLELVDGGELVAQAGGGLELLGLGGGHHAGGEGALQLGVAAFEEKLRVADGVRVGFRRW